MKQIEQKNQKLNGWYLFTPKVDYFFVTEQQRKSTKMLEKIQKELVRLDARGGSCNINSIYSIGVHIRLGEYTAMVFDTHGLCHSIVSRNELCWGSGDFEKNKHCEIVFL